MTTVKPPRIGVLAIQVPYLFARIAIGFVFKFLSKGAVEEHVTAIKKAGGEATEVVKYFSVSIPFVIILTNFRFVVLSISKILTA